jgi:hypothetical protein
MSAQLDEIRWRGREALELTNGVVSATVLPKGGQLAAWQFTKGHGPTQDNTLWEAPWTTVDPGSPAQASSPQDINDAGVARFLASFTGHALCLDGFGPASETEIATGAGLHGEASIAAWTFTRETTDTVVGTAMLPASQLHVSRQFSLLSGESVLRIDERVTNLGDRTRNLHWVQHATIGQPMHNGHGARVSTSAARGVTWPLPYDGDNLLDQDASFEWPLAPRASGKTADLRELFVHRGAGFVAAARHPDGRKQGFVAVCDPARRLAMGYLFATDVFPWVTFWEENCARQESPWNGSVQARGLEFGTTPLPLGNEAVDIRGPLLGMPASLPLESHATQRAPWLLFLAELPPGCDELLDVRAEEHEIVLQFKSDKVPIAAARAAEFLQADRTQKKVETV